MEIRANYIIEIATDVPRRLTSYRGRTATGARGLVVGGLYYRATNVEIPGIEESDSIAPVRCYLSLGNAENDLTDLYSDHANHRRPITIKRLGFGGVWDEALPPTGVVVTPWFEGTTGKPQLAEARLILECRADMGRRGRSPRTRSRTLMVNHQPLSPGQTITILSGGQL